MDNLKPRSELLLTATIMMLLLIGTYDTRAYAFTNGQSASLVIGQKDFTSSDALVSQSGLTLPTAVDFDSSGNMWVSEEGNSRLLKFKPPFTTGMQAFLVVGQLDFTTGLPGTTQSSLNNPQGLHFDSSGNLWIADWGNNRVLEFTSTPIPEFPTTSLAIIALASLAVVSLVSRKVLGNATGPLKRDSILLGSRITQDGTKFRDMGPDRTLTN